MRFHPHSLVCLPAAMVMTACTPSLKEPLPAETNKTCFAAADITGKTIPDDVLQQAAGITLDRGYSYFQIARQNDSTSTGSRPTLNINYGRSPYGFGDPAESYPGGLSAGISFIPPRARWCLTLAANSHDLQGAYNARNIMSGKL